MNNEPLDVKPGKVVAGLEPEKTNNLFLAIHKAASSNHNFEAIAIKIAGGTVEPEPEKQQPQPEKKPKKEKEKPKKEEKPQPVQDKPKEREEPKVVESKSQPEKEREESQQQPQLQLQPQPQIEQNPNHDDADDGLRPTTAKTKPVARKKKGDNFDKIMVEEKTLPQGIIMDNEEDEHEEEKNTSFDHNVVANKNINADNINKKQHGYMVRDILENQEENENKGHDETKDDKPKKEENKIRMGRIGTKKKEEKQGGVVNNPNNNAVAERVEITVESIEDVEALRKAIQNLCQYTNPLGRLMEQFVEDVPNLEKE